jgi:GH25 family lysozyme M1 (1,4-beta-N-acetylmuramidase)
MYHVKERLYMTKNGIDISEWQGNINWSSVNTDFCIIRAGYGRVITQKDPNFEAYYAGCKSRGIPCGVYWYSYAKTPAEAAIEADICLQVIKGKQFEYPIYFDVEEQNTFATGKNNVSEIIKAFCSKIEAAGYYAGLYMSASPLNNYVTDEVRKRYTVWVAHYGVSRPSYSGAYDIWQKGSNGRIAGISGDVDVDECYKDFPTIIKNAGLNGFPKPAAKTVQEAAKPATKPTTPAKAKKTVELTIDGKKYKGVLEEV